MSPRGDAYYYTVTNNLEVSAVTASCDTRVRTPGPQLDRVMERLGGKDYTGVRQRPYELKVWGPLPAYSSPVSNPLLSSCGACVGSGTKSHI